MTSTGRPTTRRAFVATVGATALTGCVGLGSRDPAYQIVAGVERKLLRGTSDNTIRKIAETTAPESSVVDAAPSDLAVRTVAYDDTVVDLSGSGPLVLNTTTRDRIEDGYGSPYGVVVLTLYNDDPHNGVPTGNSNGYRVTIDQFNQVQPGDRVSATVDTDRDIAAIESVLNVDSA